MGSVGSPIIRALCGKRVRFVAAASVALAFVVMLADDVGARAGLPHESTAARAYAEAMARDDPAAMWDAYSPRARAARGGDRDAYVAFMLAGARPRTGPPSHPRLLAAVPLPDGSTLLYYRIDRAATREFIVVPVAVDGLGHVEDSGYDGIEFVPPRIAAQDAAP